MYTAQDVAYCFNKVTGDSYNVIRTNGTIPTDGIWLNINQNLGIVGNQTAICTSSDNFLVFSAPYPHGVRYGVYQYMEELGIRFYGPDTLWEKFPSLPTVFQNNFQKEYTPVFSYHSWFGSGGIGFFPIDANQTEIVNYDNWMRFQVRNNMENEYIVGGHNPAIHASNPCYIAEYDNSNDFNLSSVPNVYYPEAMQEWADTLFQKFSVFHNIYPQNKYWTDVWGIEVEDGARFGNTITNTSCEPGLSGTQWMSPSDQQFTLANYVTDFFMSQASHPRKTLCFAYGAGAEVPTIDINPNIVVLLAQGFQVKKSPTAYARMWAAKHPNFFEYNYLNLPDQTGQTPFVNWKDFKNTINRIKEANGLGLFYESTFSKFSTIPFMTAANRSMKDNTNPDLALNEYYTDMWGNAAPKIKELYDLWGEEIVNTPWIWLFDNRYRLPVFNNIVHEASSLVQTPEEIERICQLKAYMVYVNMYFDVFLGYEESNSIAKMEKIDSMVNYLARINHLNIVNTYRQIELLLNMIPPQYHATYLSKWAGINLTYYDYYQGTEWANITPINCLEIDNLFQANIDNAVYNPVTDPHTIVSAYDIINEACAQGLKSRDTIGFHFYSSSGATLFNIENPIGNPITINYENDTTNSTIYINLDAEDQSFSYDTAIVLTGAGGNLILNFPFPGAFKLSIATEIISHVDFKILTNGNFFYKNGPANPLYYEDHSYSMESFPEYIYVPEGTSKIYTCISARCSPYCLDSTEMMNTYFVYQPDGVQSAQNETTDSLLLYYNVPTGMDGKFWKMHSYYGSYPMTTINFQNRSFYFEPGICENLPINEVEKTIPIETMSVYPNPNSGNFTIESRLNFDNENITILDFSGRVIHSQKLTKGQNKEEIKLSTLSKGIYFIQFTDEKNRSNIKKIVIN